MVISYTMDELLAIGEKVTLEGLMAGSRYGLNDTKEADIYEFSELHKLTQVNITDHIQQICRMSSQFTKDDQGRQEPTSEELAESVVEFFRKAQQNFYAKTSIDPTKVRSLSEVEAELISQRASS